MILCNTRTHQWILRSRFGLRYFQIQLSESYWKCKTDDILRCILVKDVPFLDDTGQQQKWEDPGLEIQDPNIKNLILPSDSFVSNYSSSKHAFGVSVRFRHFLNSQKLVKLITCVSFSKIYDRLVRSVF